MAQARKAQVIITANASVAEKVMQELEGAATRASNRMKALADTGAQIKERMRQLAAANKQNTDEYKQLDAQLKQNNKDFKAAEKEFQAFNSRMRENVKDTKRVEETMKQLANTATRDLRRALQAARRELEKMSEKDPRRTQMISDMRKLQAQIDANTGSLKKQQGVWGTLGTTMKNLFAYAGIFAGFNKLKGLLEDVIKLNLKFSDKIADIRKVSGLAMSDINQLATNLTKIDTRSSMESLMGLAYQGSKLGFGEYGISGLESFTKAANQVNVALHEDLGDDAMVQLSKMTEVMGLIPKMGVEKAMLATGSAIFKLASTSTAAGGPIVEFSKRLMGLANQAGITAEELVAFGASADSMALAPEVAATAFNKLITAVQKQPNLIENALHMEPGTINNLFQAGQMTDAIVKIFEAMNQKGGMNALMHSGVFKDLGSDGARLVGVMATMANRVDMVQKALATSRKAFKDASAVTDEYNIQQETAAALTERANNLWNKAFVNPEGVDNVKDLAQAWYDVSKSLTENKAAMTSIQILIVGLMKALQGLLMILPGLLYAFGTRGLIWMFNTLGTAFGAATIKANGFRAAWTAMSVAMKANWISLAIGLLIQLTVYLVSTSEKLKELLGIESEAEKKAEDMRKAYVESHNAAEQASKGIEKYKEALEDANMTQEQRTDLIKKFKNEYGDYLRYLGIEIKTVDDLRDAYADVVRVMQQKKLYEERENYKQNLTGERKTENRKVGVQIDEELKKLGINTDEYNFGNIQKISGYGAERIYTGIMENYFGKNEGKDIEHWVSNATNRRSYKSLDGRKLLDLIRKYTEADQSIRADEREADKMWANDLKGFDNDRFEKGKFKSHLNNYEALESAPDKDAARAAKKAEAERRKALRAEMKEEQAQAKAIIDNVKNYYQRQINAITEMANTTGMDPKLQEQMVNGMKERMNEALANVRKAIGGTKNDWEAFKQTMRDDLYEPLGEDGTNLSTELLDKVMDNNLDQLRTMIEKLSKELNQQGSVLLDQILRKASENEGINAKIENALMRAREKELLERNYTGKVDKDTEGTMEQFGIAAITDAQSKQIRDWSAQGNDAAIERFLEMRTKYWQVAFGNARKNLLDLLQQDVNTKQGQESVLQLLFGEDWKEGLTGSELEGILNMTADQWQVFYEKLIEYTDRWTDAQKKAYDKNKKRQDYIFNNRTDVMGLNTLEIGYEQKAKANQRWGKPQTFAERMGLGSMESMTNDPEVKMMEIKLTKAELYYKRMEELRKTDQISEEQLMDAKKQWSTAQEALMDKLAEQAKQKMEQIQQLLDPIKEFGAAAGDAMYLTVNGLEGEGEAWRNAVKNIIKTYGEMTIKLIEEQLLKMLVLKQHHQEEEDEEQAHQDRMKQIQNQGDTNEINAQNVLNAKIISTKRKANKTEEKEDKKAEDEKVNIAGEGGTQLLDIATQVGTGMVTAKKQEADQTQQIEQQQQATSLSGLISDTVAKVVLGIAGGSAKTISELGWWGLPLVAVISAALMGLLNYALSAIGGGGGGSEKAAAKPKVKLASGMLTYDKGNVQQTVGSQWRGKNGEYITDDRRTVVGDDGRVYRAREQRSLPEGVSMVTEPIATRVNGQQALVGERGPEIVIGRRTTRAIQMNRPDLLRDLALIDRGITTRKVRTFDEGNISDMATAFAGQLPAPQPSADGQQGSDNAQRERDQAMLATLGVLSQTIGQLQQQLAAGIHAEMNMFGDNGAYKKFQQADKFYKKYGG